MGDVDVDLDSNADRDWIDLLAEEFAARCRRGEQPSVSEYAARHPEHAERIRAVLPAVALMEQLKRHRENPEEASAGFAADAADQAGAAAPPVERLGDLRIVREIGRGGMGIVYEAVQETLDRRVAVKLLPRHSFLNPRTLRRFGREAQAVAQLHHPHIVPVFGVGEQDGLHYYFMQLIAGRGLHQVIRALRHGRSVEQALEPAGTTRAAEAGEPAVCDSAEVRGRLDDRYWRFAARVARDVAEALEYAHGQGVLHRDIKPANLLLDDQGTVWVTDFGLAKLAQQGDLTATGDIIGTLQYMAPEGLQGESDARSDVYGLGMTLYEMITLEPPFEESNPSRLIRRVGEDQPVRPRKRNPAIPRDLETIVLKATARDPGGRYPTAQAMADDLARFLDDRPIAARRATLTERCTRWCRRNKALAALGATALASLVFAAVVGWVGYATTRKALESELQRRREAEAATRRADANVALSLSALEEIFNNLTPSPLGPSFGPAGSRLGGPPNDPLRPTPGPPPGRGRGFDNGQTALLQSILGFYDRFAALNETNAILKREAAKAHRRIGDLRQRLGQRDAASAAFGRSAALFEALADEFPDSPDDRHALAETLIVEDPHSNAPEALQAALTRWQRARAIEQELASEFPDKVEYVNASALIEGRLGTVLDRLGQTSEAESSLRQAVALRGSLAERFPEGSYTTLLRTVARTALGGFLLKHGQSEEARTCLDACAAEVEETASQPRSPETSGLLALELDDLAALYRSLGETSRAAALTALAQGLYEPGPGGRRPGLPPPRGHGPGPRDHNHDHDRDRPPPPPGEPWDGGPDRFAPGPRRPPPPGHGP
jgi:tetratricopeptide (TPR) repeat protein